jgi:hypothetical protein
MRRVKEDVDNGDDDDDEGMAYPLPKPQKRLSLGPGIYPLASRG